MQLGVERLEKLNRTKNPCGHSFTDCIDDYVAKNVGCNLLERREISNMSKCTTVQEIRKFEETYFMFFTSTNKEFVRLTGCLPPCTYRKYTVLYKQQISNEFGIQLEFAAKEISEITVMKEVGLN